jgi:hypothetical protein
MRFRLCGLLGRGSGSILSSAAEPRLGQENMRIDGIDRLNLSPNAGLVRAVDRRSADLGDRPAGSRRRLLTAPAAGADSAGCN